MRSKTTAGPAVSSKSALTVYAASRPIPDMTMTSVAAFISGGVEVRGLEPLSSLVDLSAGQAGATVPVVQG